MPETKAFADTNIVLHTLSSDSAKSDKAEVLINEGCKISVQVLNEMANVAYRKLSMRWDEIAELSHLIQTLCDVVPVTTETHKLGLEVAQRYPLSLYDSMIVAAALLAECKILYSEDMHNGLVVEEHLRICNPFT